MSLLARMTGRDGALLVVDIQDKLSAKIARSPWVIANTARLVKAARLLNLPVWATEQYPKGLGSTVPPLLDLLPTRPSKTTFHCCAVPEILEQLHGHRLHHLTLVGIETHICIAQTALELMQRGFRVQVPADGVASRFDLDHEIALRRLERAGAVITTTETVLFEWVETADHPKFREISELVTSFVPPA